jgi:hypothetical protein
VETIPHTEVLRSLSVMDAAVWTTLAILAAISIGTLFNLGAHIDSLATRTDARLDRMDARFDHVDARFDHVDVRFDTLIGRMILGSPPISTDTRPDLRPIY